MPPESLLIFLCFAFGAEVVGTIAGFGAATILTPIASTFFDIKTAVALVACFHLFGNAWRAWWFRGHQDWRLIACFGIAGIATSFAGASVAARLSPAYLRLLLGLFLLVYAGTELAQAARLKLQPTSTTLIVGGALSGVVAGAIGTGGAIRSACLVVFGLPKERYLGTSALIALLMDATRVPVYLSQGWLPGRMAGALAALSVVAFAGSWLGQRLVKRIAPARFTQMVLVLLLLLGIKLLWDGWRGVA